MKNYIGFVNDHSGSMCSLANAAKTDYNANITATKDAASREMLDTVVSVVGVGIGDRGYGTQRQVVISNPHVLRPVTSWSTDGGTPLWDGVGDMIELFESLPDYNSPNVSFLVMTTTDGREEHSKKYNATSLANKIKQLQNTGRWTFVFRVPKGNRHYVEKLGVPLDNIQEWETTSAGMARSTTATTQAMDNYFTTRATGKGSTTVFYANANSVNVAALKDITNDVSLYVVPTHLTDGIQIRDFILTKRMQYLKGSAFYQLTKTEPRISHTKLIAVRDRTTGKIYSGKDARDMIGLPNDRNARLHPGDHGNYDIFIQSESVNRKLIPGTGVLYWEAIGKPFADNDPALSYGQPQVTNGVVQLPPVAPTNRPTPSPLQKVAKATVPTVGGKAVRYFRSRDEGRSALKGTGKVVRDARKLPTQLQQQCQQRWLVFLE